MPTKKINFHFDLKFKFLHYGRILLKILLLHLQDCGFSGRILHQILLFHLQDPGFSVRILLKILLFHLQDPGFSGRILLTGSCSTLSSNTECTSLAIYSLEQLPQIYTGLLGRPKLGINENVILELRSLRFKWKDISDMLLVSRWTIRRRVIEYGIQDIKGFSQLSDEHVRNFMQQRGNLVGFSMTAGYLQSIGLRVKRDRIRASIGRVDPTNVRLRWAVVTSRRTYSVPGPNSLWH